MLHRVSTQYIIFYFVLFLFGFVSRAHYICRTEGDGRKGQRDERKARMREKQNCKVTRVKIMEFPPPKKKMKQSRWKHFLCSCHKMGPPVLSYSLSLPLTTATDMGAFVIWMTNYYSGLFSKSKNLLSSHSFLKEKK